MAANGIRAGAAPSGQNYAEALATRASRFEPALEAQFAAYHITVSRNRVRFWHSLMLVLALSYLLARVVLAREQIHTFELFLRLAVLIPIWGVLAAIAWGGAYERLYMPIARVLIPINVCAFAVLATMRMAEGRLDVFATITTTLLGTLFLSGLLFRHAVLSGALMLIAFVATALALEMSLITVGYSSASAVTALVVGAFVYYDMEMTNRRAFLQQSIADSKANNDALTGLANRRAFDEFLAKLWKQAARERKALAICLIDVDHFKKYNDRYGHQSGDRCLSAVGKVVGAFARRPLDFAARLGGEEMALLLYDMEASKAREIAQHLCDAVEDLAIDHADSINEKVITVSIGLASAQPTDERSSAGLLQLADEALYQAKKQGRNRVVLKHEHEYEALQTGVFRMPGEKG